MAQVMHTLKNILLRILGIFLIIVGCVCLSFGLGHDDTLLITRYEVDDVHISEPLKIMQLSDFHNHGLDYPNTNLIDAIEDVEKDIVFLTGDIIDQYTSEDDLKDFEEILKTLDGIPIYYIRGNHEYYANEPERLYTLLDRYGVVTLEDEVTTFSWHGVDVNIYGLHDIKKEQLELNQRDVDVRPFLDDLVKQLPVDEDDVNILLAHRPEYMPIYKEYNFDYVFSGHTHGGQINMLGIGVPIIDGQGLFPQYVRGEYVETYEGHTSHLYINAGLGMNNVLAIRYNCPPEIVQVTLR